MPSCPKTLRDLQSKQRLSEGAFSIIFVEITGHKLRTVGRRAKLKNKVWHSSHYRHIALLKRIHKQVEIRYHVIYKTTRIHSERIPIVSPEILHTERDDLAPLSTNFFFIINDFTLLWTTTVLTDRTLRLSKSTG